MGETKKVIGLAKHELDRKLMKEVVALRPKMYRHLSDDSNVHEKVKGTKKCINKRDVKFQHCEECLENNKAILRSQHRFSSEAHNVFTEEVNKITLSANDDKRMQAPNRVTTYPYGYES